MCIRKCLFIPLFLISVFFCAFAEEGELDFPQKHDETHRFMPLPPPKRDIMNLNGRKMLRHDGKFSVTGVKLEKIPDRYVFSIYFNEPLDTRSVHSQRILINEFPLPPDTDFLFNKPRSMLRFSIKNPVLQTEKPSLFSIRILEVRSFDGKILQPTEIKNIQADSFYKQSRGEQKWMKL